MNKPRHIANPSLQLAILGTAILSSIAAYLYFLNISVVHVVLRQDAIQEAATLQAEIAMLETEYIAAKHTIAQRVAQLDGFDTEVDKIFITRANRDTLARTN